MKFVFTTFIAVFLIGSSLSAQTTHEVEVANFSFTPNMLEIEQGDIVRWTNVSGTHSVDGSEESFPNNPEFFGNEIASGNWTYEFQFNTPGNYEYVCGVHSGMLGFISVGSAQSTNDTNKDLVSFFPNPAKDFVEIQGLGDLSGTVRIELYDVSGKLLIDQNLNATNRISLESYAAGMLTYTLYQDNHVVQQGKIVKTQ
jgi:plastocyanin